MWRPHSHVRRTGRPIRRVLSSAAHLAVRNKRTAISLGTVLPQPSCGLPGALASSLSGTCLTLLRARFTQRARSLGPLVVSYTTVSPLPRRDVRAVAVYSLLHFLADHSGWVLPTALLCGARTFLGVHLAVHDATVWPARSPVQDSGKVERITAVPTSSDPGLGGAHEDGARVGAQQHVIGCGGPHSSQIVRVEGDAARARHATAQK